MGLFSRYKDKYINGNKDETIHLGKSRYLYTDKGSFIYELEDKTIIRVSYEYIGIMLERTVYLEKFKSLACYKDEVKEKIVEVSEVLK